MFSFPLSVKHSPTPRRPANVNSLFVLNNFQDGIDFSVDVVELLHLAHVQEELEILIDGTRCVVIVIGAVSVAFILLALNAFANRVERLLQVVEEFGCDI